MIWQQNYDPFHNIILSCLVASITVIVMLALLGLWHVKAHYAAGLGLLSAAVIAILRFPDRTPRRTCCSAACRRSPPSRSDSTRC